MIGGHIRIAIEQPFTNPEDVKSDEEDDREQNAEENSQRENRFAVLVNRGDDRVHR